LSGIAKDWSDRTFAEKACGSGSEVWLRFLAMPGDIGCKLGALPKASITRYRKQCVIRDKYGRSRIKVAR